MMKHSYKPFNKTILSVALVASLFSAAPALADEPAWDTPIDDSREEVTTPTKPQPVPVPVTGADFQDVTSFYAPAVEYLIAREVTTGKTDTLFGTTDKIIRADAAIWLAKELALDTANAPASGFKDVPERAQAAVNALKQAGITQGKGPTRYGAYDPLTRGEVALILQRAYDLPADDSTSQFNDVSSRYQSAVNALVAADVTDGISPSHFGVKSDITRGQLAVFIHRLSK